VLDVTGTATLNGTLNVATYGGFIGQQGDSFTPLLAGGGLGGTTFSTINAPTGYTVSVTYPGFVQVDIRLDDVPTNLFGFGFFYQPFLVATERSEDEDILYYFRLKRYGYDGEGDDDPFGFNMCRY
jgi:hypothetical protein